MGKVLTSLERSGVFRPIAGPSGRYRGVLSAPEWLQLAEEIRQEGGRLLALWGTEAHEQIPPSVHALWRLPHAVYWVSMHLGPDHLQYPSLSRLFPTATRMERAVYDLLGFTADGNADRRPWVRHEAWPKDCFPLRRQEWMQNQLGTAGDAHYPFFEVAGEDVHEIPVGPVHAGSIEPGHFRFSCVGEKIVRLEERLGYTHKGVAKLFLEQDLDFGLRLAGRISGDSTVAFAWAYVMAAEQVAGLQAPVRAQFLRALALERERLLNHLGDLGALGNDAGFAFVLSQLLALKENLLRENEHFFGHRYLMDYLTLGGVQRDLPAAACQSLLETVARLRTQLTSLEVLLAEHSGLRDRMVGTGMVVPERARAWGMGGLVGRASGQGWDLRNQLPWPPYDQFACPLSVQEDGDVAARWAQRWTEIYQSLSLQEDLLEKLPKGSMQATLVTTTLHGEGLGIVEGWRGEVACMLCVREGRLLFCHPQDPSTALWPVLEEAVLQDIVADFPLINKSFNLSYSGQDL